MNLASPQALSLVIVAIGLAGGVLPFFFKWTHRSAHRWIAFGAGTVLGAAFIHMIPEAYELAGPKCLSMLLVGFLALYAVEQASFGHPHDEEAGEFHQIGFLTFLGFTLHDLIDGIALSSGEFAPQLTSPIFIALALHKVPTTFALSLLMLHGEMKRRTIVLYLTALLCAIPLGTLIGPSLLASAGARGDMAIGMLVAFSAGTFIYIGAYELLPEMQRKTEPGSKIWFFFLLGVASLFVLKFLHPVF